MRAQGRTPRQETQMERWHLAEGGWNQKLTVVGNLATLKS